MMTRMLILILGISCLVLADDEPRQSVQVTNTQHMDLPLGGTVRLKNSTGELTIEGWDQPGVEITTVKSVKGESASSARQTASHELDRVQIAAARQGDELVVTTDFPRHRGFPPSSPFGGATHFDLEYHIRVPRDARLIVDHDVGNVYFDNVTGDIHATMLQGAMTLHLPEGGQYAIDAKSDLGDVISDFAGSGKRRRWLVGHQFIQNSPAPHRLYLRDGFGDIIILKIRKPPAPPPLNQ
jgi:hypothetical protein